MAKPNKPIKLGHQAKDDVANTLEDSGVSIDVLDNDAGGNKTFIYSLDQDDPLAVATTGTSKLGATITIVNGEVFYDPVGAPAIEALAEGQKAVDSFTYTIDHNGTLSTGTVFVSLTGVNDASVLNVAAQASYTENGAPVTVSPNVSLADVDSQQLVGARVQITSLPAGVHNPCELHFTAIGNITGSYNDQTGVLTLTGADSVANYQAALASVSFDIASDNPTYFGKHLTHTIEWQVDDGSGFDNLSKVATTVVTINAVNDAPVLNGVAAQASYTEHDDPLPISPNLSLADVDSRTLDGATVKITDGLMPCDQLQNPGPDHDHDELHFTNVGNIVGSYDLLTGVLTFTGIDSVANYQLALASVSFEASADNPTNFRANLTRTIEWQVNDGAGFDNLSKVATTTLTIEAVNDAPVLSGVAAPSDYTENGAPVALWPNLALTDADSQTLAGATVKITDGFYPNGPCALRFTEFGNIHGSYDSKIGVLTFTGADSVANYQAVLASVSLEAPGDNPTNSGANPSRTIELQVSDGSGANNLSNIATTLVTINPVNDAPLLSGVAAQASYTENAAPVVLSPNLVLADVDSKMLAGATVQITGGFMPAGAVMPCDLQFKPTGQITGEYDPVTRVLTLTGSDSVANYQKVLASVSFDITGDNPTYFGKNSTYTIKWQVDDGSGANTLSDVATTVVTIVPVNDAPVLKNVAAQASYTENNDPLPIAPNISLADVDSRTLAGATVKITDGLMPCDQLQNPGPDHDHDELHFTNVGNIVGSYDLLTGVLTFTGIDSVANYQLALASVSFEASADNPTNFGANLTRTIEWQVNDGAGFDNLSKVATTTLTIEAVNDAPVLSGVAATATFTEGDQPVALSPNLSLADVDSPTLVGATVKITSDFFPSTPCALHFTDFGNIHGNYDIQTRTLTFTGLDSVANYQAALASVTFEAPDDNATNFGKDPTRTIEWQVNDDSGGLSSIQTTLVTINAINDAPVADDDSYTASSGKTLHVDATKGVLNGDSDVDSFQFSAFLKDGPAHGDLTLNPDGSFDYTPDDGFSGSDGFAYVANDGEADSNIATVLIDVIKLQIGPPQDFFMV